MYPFSENIRYTAGRGVKKERKELRQKMPSGPME